LSDATIVKEALEFALEHSQGPEKWIFPNYKAGLAGFDSWINTLNKGEATGVGMAYNASTWLECRSMACLFLREAMYRLDGKVRSLLDEASNAYYPVVDNLARIVDLFPFPPGGEINDRYRQLKAIGYLKKAREAEEKGLECLQKIVAML